MHHHLLIELSAKKVFTQHKLTEQYNLEMTDFERPDMSYLVLYHINGFNAFHISPQIITNKCIGTVGEGRMYDLTVRTQVK